MLTDEFRKKENTVEKMREQNKFRTNARNQIIQHHFYTYLLNLSKEEIEDVDDKFLKNSKLFARVWYKEIVDKLYESTEDERNKSPRCLQVEAVLGETSSE